LNNKGEIEYVFTTEGHIYPINFVSKQMKNYSSTYFKNKSKDSIRNKCELKADSGVYFSKLRRQLPMKMKYFDQLFEMVGVNDNIENLLERKKS
jgi:hypothetical protein